MREVDQELFDAVRQGNLSRVKRCIDQGANVHAIYTILGIKPIHVAAREGHREIIEFLLNKRASVNDRDKDSWTPLHYAAKRGHLEVIQFLLEKDADINVRDGDGKTPLDLARKDGHMEVVNILGGAKPKVVGRGLSNVYFGSEKVQELDRKYSGDELKPAKKGMVNYLEYRGHIYLHLVRGKDRGMSAWHYVLVDPGKNEMFLEKEKTGSIDVADYGKILYSGWGQDPPQSVVDKVDRFFHGVSGDLFLIKEERKDKSLYHYVLIDQDKKEMFLEQSKTGSALIREIENYGRVLYSGWGQDPSESISDRIERAYFWDDEDWEEEFANLSVKDSNTLRDAARNSELEAVRYFIRKGVNINSADKNGWTSLHHAAYGGSLRVVKYLIDNGADLRVQDTVCGRKPVHIAAREGNTGIVRLFLSKGIGVNDADENNWVPLHYAAWNGYLETAKFLVDEGANIHAKDANHGKKPVHTAARKGHANIVEFFLRNGVGIDDNDKEGRTLLYYAVLGGHLEAVKFLVGKGANIHAGNTYGVKPIHAAALSGHKNILEFFLNRGISVNEPSKDNCTPLHCAAHAGESEVVKFLIKEGANIHAKDNDGETPLDYAKKAGRMEIVNILDSAENKSQLPRTTGRTDDKPESDLSGVTVKKQPMRTRAPGN